MIKTAFVTGATSGFGLATVQRFAEAGWRVVATGRRADRLQALADQLGRQRIHVAAFDIRDADAMQAALDARPDGFQFWVFQENERARRFYEAHGAVAVELTDGSGNEERTPDVRYEWRPRAPGAPGSSVR